MDPIPLNDFRSRHRGSLLEARGKLHLMSSLSFLGVFIVHWEIG